MGAKLPSWVMNFPSIAVKRPLDKRSVFVPSFQQACQTAELGNYIFIDCLCETMRSGRVLNYPAKLFGGDFASRDYVLSLSP